MHRRTFLKGAGPPPAPPSLGFPAVLRAQVPTFKVGAIHPVTGPLAEPGQACRLGAQMAADAINAAGGIKSLNGMKLDLIVGDTQTKPDIGRTEAERAINQGAQMLMGSFDSGSTAAMVPVAQQRRIPFLVDIAAADPITANVAKAVKEGQQKVQYVYRNFPTGSSFGRKAVQYFTEVFQEAKVSPKRVVLMYCNDLFGAEQRQGLPGRPRRREALVGDRRRHPVAGAAPGPLHRGLARQGGQARHHRADHAAGERPAAAARDPQAAPGDPGHRGAGQPGPLRGRPARGAQGGPRLRDEQPALGRTSRTRAPRRSPRTT